MIKVRIQIGDGSVLDSESGYGLIYLSSDNVFEAPLKTMESTSYPEQAGKNVNPKTVRDSFDYKVKFFIKAGGSLGNANAVIASFNNQLYDEVDGVMTFKRVVFYNDYKKVKISGIPKLIQEATDFWRDDKGRQADVVCAEWNITVDNPSLCDFNID